MRRIEITISALSADFPLPPAENRVLDGRFEGKLTSSKWAKMTKTSQDTAQRDIVDLIERGALTKNPGGGRSTSYSLVTDVVPDRQIQPFVP